MFSLHEEHKMNAYWRCHICTSELLTLILEEFRFGFTSGQYNPYYIYIYIYEAQVQSVQKLTPGCQEPILPYPLNIHHRRYACGNLLAETFSIKLDFCELFL
jgi:hypothetical protein